MLRRTAPWLLGLAVALIAFASLFRGQVQAGRDLYALFFPDAWYLAQRFAHLELPLWLPYARLGQPFAAELFTQAFYPPAIVTALVFGPAVGPSVQHLFHALFGFAGSFLSARRLRLTRWAAFIAAAPFSLSPFFIEFAQNLSFAASAAWAGWVLWGALRLVERVSARRTAALAGLLAGSFLAGGPEMWLWQVGLVGAVVIPRGRPELALKAGLAVLGALAAGAVVALPAAELAREFTRPGEAPPGALEWSLSFTQLLALGVPDGDLPRAGDYWGGVDQHFLFSLFMGAVPLALGTRGLWRRRARPVLWLGAGCLLLALGKNFLPSALLLSVPPLTLFRYPAKYAVGLVFALSISAGVGAQTLAARARRATPRFFAAALGLAALVALGARLVGARAGLLEGSLWSLVALAALAAAVRLRRRQALPVIAALVALELVVAPHETWPRLPAARLLEPSPIAAQLRAERAGRVSVRVDMNDTDSTAAPGAALDGDQIILASRARLSGLRFIEEGLHATGGYGFRDPWRLGQAFRAGPTPFALAGVTHLVRNVSEPPRWPTASRADTVFPDIAVWRTSGAFPRAWLTPAARVASDEEALQALAGGPELFRATTLLAEGLPLPAAPIAGCESRVDTRDDSPEQVTQAVHACGVQELVLADAWYPGWEARVDGAQVPVRRADYFLRSVRVEGGDHQVQWRYRPRSFAVGATLSLVAWASIAVGLFFRRREASGRTGPC